MNEHTRKRIEEAVSTLAKQRDRVPTQDEVRDYLGKGSYSYISAVLKEWRAKHLPELTGSESALERATRAVRESLYDEVDAVFREKCDEQDALYATLADDLAEFGNQNGQLTTEFEQLQSAFLEREAELADARAKIDALEQSLSKREDEARSLHQQNRALSAQLSDAEIGKAAAEAKLAALEVSHKNDQQTISHLVESNDQRKREIARLEIEVGKAEKREEATFASFAESEKQRKVLDAALTERQLELLDLAQRYNEKFESMEARLAASASAHDKTKQEYSTAFAQLAQLREQFDHQATKKELYLIKLAAAENELAQLRGELKSSRSDDSGDMFES